MEIRFPNGEIDTLRLLGVDTPETFGENDPAEFEGIPENAAGRDHLAEWGERATAFATDGCATHRYSPAGDDPRLAGE